MLAMLGRSRRGLRPAAQSRQTMRPLGQARLAQLVAQRRELGRGAPLASAARPGRARGGARRSAASRRRLNSIASDHWAPQRGVEGRRRPNVHVPVADVRGDRLEVPEAARTAAAERAPQPGRPGKPSAASPTRAR